MRKYAKTDSNTFAKFMPVDDANLINTKKQHFNTRFIDTKKKTPVTFLTHSPFAKKTDLN